MKLPAGTIKKIAVFRALQLGDMLCAIPGIRCLRYAYPDAKITLLGLPWANSFTQRFNKYFDAFIHFPGYEGLPEQPYDEAKTSLFISRMQQENFDLILQMQGNGTIVNDLMFKFNATHVAGFFNAESYVNSTLFIPYPDYGSEIKRHLILMNHLGIELQGLDLEFPVTEKDKNDFNESGLGHNEKYICIHPGSRNESRQWPPQYFAALAYLCIESGFKVVITGTAEEAHITQQLIKWIQEPVLDLTGKTSLGTAAAVLKNASMLIANCTGVSHIASAVKTPSIIISMDGEPERWGPLNRSIHTVIDCKSHSNFNEVYTQTGKLINNLKKIPEGLNAKINQAM